MITIADLAERRGRGDELDAGGRPREPLIVVDLESDPAAVMAAAEVAGRIAGRSAVLAGVASASLSGAVDVLVERLDLAISPIEQPDRRVVAAPVEPALEAIRRATSVAPLAAIALTGVLRETSVLPVDDGLLAESFAYSTLQAGPEFARWLAGRPRRSKVEHTGPSVRVERHGDRLIVALARPERRNAYDRRMRDELVEALALLDFDDTIAEVELRGDGPAFCSGGDLDEFGCAPDPATAHLIRTVRSAATLLHAHRDRVQVFVQGACVGAGAELPAFAGHVTANADAWFHLPEVSMGLIPGAGGTVSISRRIGRWRTAYLALSGERLDAATARSWGLIDDITTPGR
jgi:hypothetical protein